MINTVLGSVYCKIKIVKTIIKKKIKVKKIKTI